MDATVRRLQNNLITLGTGVIAFGVWTVIKFILYCVVNSDDLQATVAQDDIDFFFSIPLIGFALINLGICCTIGFSARAEGHGKHTGPAYVVVASINVFFYVAIIALDVALLFFDTDSLFTVIINFIIDTTSMMIMIEMIVSSIKLRNLRKQQGVCHE